MATALLSRLANGVTASDHSATIASVVTYRDESTALAEQNRALQQELAQTRSELQSLRHEHAPEPIEPARSAAPAFVIIAAGAALFVTVLIVQVLGFARPPFDELVALGSAFAVLLVLIGSVLTAVRVIKQVPHGRALVTITQRQRRVTFAGERVVVWPFSQAHWLSTAPRKTSVALGLALRDAPSASMDFFVHTELRAESASILRFFDRWGDGRGPAFDSFLRERIESAARATMAHFEQSELERERERIESELVRALEYAVESHGLAVLSVSYARR